MWILSQKCFSALLARTLSRSYWMKIKYFYLDSFCCVAQRWLAMLVVLLNVDVIYAIAVVRVCWSCWFCVRTTIARFPLVFGAHKTSTVDRQVGAAFECHRNISRQSRITPWTAIGWGDRCYPPHAFKRQPLVQVVLKCWSSSFCSNFCEKCAQPHDKTGKKRKANEMKEICRMLFIDWITVNHRSLEIQSKHFTSDLA